MKKNRSNKYTQGLVITNNTNDKRFLFFELDNPFNQGDYDKVLGIYRNNGLDVLVHRTGNGLHFLSPTLIKLETWKALISLLKGINKKCPMTTLRVLPNKWPNEESIWWANECWGNIDNSRNNSNELSNWLKQKFHCPFEGEISTELKFVRYPLP